MMKQFDKWYEKEVGSIDFPGIKEFYEARKKTWRAALEEVLTQLNNIYDGDFENSDIVKWIKQELGDQNDQS